MKSIACIGIASMTLSGLALGATGNKKAAGMNGTDRNFMQTLAKAGMAEIQAGQIAAQQGNRYERKFGRQMAKQHQALGGQLASLAAKRNVALPSSPAPADAAAIHRLEKLKGSQFRAAYQHFAIVSHRQALGLFKMEIMSGRDPALKAWAQKTLPMIQEHYQEAKDL